MKFSAAVILSLSTYAFAVSIADLPSCSIACFTTAVGTTSCGLTDTECQCTTGKSAITASVTPCLAKACSASDQAKAASVSAEICVAAASASGSATASGAASASKAVGSATSAAASAGSSAAATQSANAAAGLNVEMFGAGAAMMAAVFAL